MNSPLLNRRELLKTLAAGVAASITAGVAASLVASGPKLAYGANYQPGPVTQPAKIVGEICYAKKVGPPAKAKLSGDCAYCRKFDLREEDLLVGARGGLRNVAVYLEGISTGKAAPAESPVLAENRCTFVPHVLTVTTGSKVTLFNQDPVLNTFHALLQPSGRTLFNVGLPNKDQKVVRRIRDEGVIKMLCDVHPWEIAWVLSIPHPYHTVSSGEGKFILEEIPAGKYTLVSWHEKLGIKKQPVTLAAGQTAKIVINY